MSETSKLSFPEAARRFGVTVRVLRSAIRAGRLPAPPQLSATAILPAEWLASAQAAVAASPKALSQGTTQKVPAFARYKGTSVWRKYPARVREYARFCAMA
jgi:hypothetical protein